MAEVRSSLAVGTARSPRRILVAVVALVAAVVVSAAAYGGYVLTRPATHLDSIGCYAQASLDADTAVVSSAGRGAPAEACAALWSDAFPGVQQPRRFAVCVLESGAIGVFPATSRETCASLGIARLQDSGAPGGGSPSG